MSSLTYHEPLKLLNNYKYDFVYFDFYPLNVEGGGVPAPLKGGAIVFRTIIDNNKGFGNVLIDFIDWSNLNAFAVAKHGNAHVHIIKVTELMKQQMFSVSDRITIEAIQNKSGNTEFKAIIKDQKYQSIETKEHRMKKIPVDFKHFEKLNYLLFTKYNRDFVDIDEYQPSPMIELKKDLLWSSNRWHNHNNLVNLDVETIYSEKLDEETPWKDVKKKINKDKNYWEKVNHRIFKDYLAFKDRQYYFPIEK